MNKSLSKHIYLTTGEGGGRSKRSGRGRKVNRSTGRGLIFRITFVDIIGGAQLLPLLNI